MSIATLGNRLLRLKGNGMDQVDLLAALDAGGRRAKAWHAAGNTGPVPFEPLPDPPADTPRAQRELWAAIAAGRARVARALAEYRRQ